MTQHAEQKREEILRLVAEYYSEAFAPRPFVPGESVIRYAGRVFDADELTHAVDAVLDFWLTAGRFAEEFESNLAEFFPSIRPCSSIPAHRRTSWPPAH